MKDSGQACLRLYAAVSIYAEVKYNGFHCVCNIYNPEIWIRNKQTRHTHFTVKFVPVVKLFYLEFDKTITFF